MRTGENRGGGQHPGDHDRRFHPRRGPRLPGRCPDARHRTCGGRPPGWNRVDATRIATALVGDAIATNMFMLGYAWQKGRIPLSREAIRRAIEINAVAVESNLSAFDWGTAHRGRPGRGGASGRAGGGGGGAAAQAREPGVRCRATRGVPRGIPGCGVRPALPGSRRAGAGRPSAPGRRGCAGSRRRVARGLLQAACVQGRVRSRTPARLAGVPAPARSHVRGGTSGWNSTSRHHCSHAAIRTPASLASDATARG